VATHSITPGNRLLAALPAADFRLLTPHLRNIPLALDAVLVHSGDQFEKVYFPHSGAIAFVVERAGGQAVATSLMGSEGAIGALTVLGRSSSPVTATARVAGTASQISVAKLQFACAQSFAIRHVVEVHLRTQLLQLQDAAACNALHSVEHRMARWLLQLHDRVLDDVIPLKQETLAQLLGVRRTTVTLIMNKLRTAGAIKSDRRGLIEIDRARLERMACGCYAVMQSRIGRRYDDELSAPPQTTVPLRQLDRR
jgi:CRP-like cAMP-binding protein